MFCKKCGNEVSPSEKFCSKCGTPVAPAAPQPQVQARPQAQASQVSFSIPPQVKHPLGIMYLATAFLHLLQLIFWSLNTVKVGEGKEAVKFSLSTLFSRYMMKTQLGYMDMMTKSFATVLTTIFAVTAIVLCVMPVLTNTLNKGRLMICQIFTSVWTLGWLIYGVNCIPGDFEASLDLGFSVFGWLFLILTIVTVLLNVVIILIGNKIISVGK